MFTQITDVMDNGTNSTLHFDKEFHDIMNKNEHYDIKSTVICVIRIGKAASSRP